MTRGRALKNDLSQTEEDVVLIAFFRFVTGGIAVVQADDCAGTAQFELYGEVRRGHHPTQLTQILWRGIKVTMLILHEHLEKASLATDSCKGPTVALVP